MTEDEARKKWCPFARVPDGGGLDGRQLTATNRHAGDKTGRDGKPRILRGNAMCIVTECMAWRSTGHIKGPVVERIRAEPLSIRPDGWGYDPADPDSASAGGDWVRREQGPATGFCGLAGQPA